MENLKIPPIITGLDFIEPIKGGEIGVVMAGAGVGKTALLCLIALEEISKSGRVLHICIDETPEKIKTWYEEIYRSYFKDLSRIKIKEILSKIEPLRFVASFLHNSFSFARFKDIIANLTDQANFNPSLVIIDGLDFERTKEDFFKSLKTFIKERSLPVWMSARAHKHITEKSEKGIPYPCNLVEPYLDIILVLERGEQNFVSLKLVKDRNNCYPDGRHMPFKSPIFR